MKVIFAGPSLYGAEIDEPSLTFRPPAGQGDVLRATLQGATAIGLIDGVFGSAASVWHKEILHALSLGVRVLGAASMGALRAAECVRFGMEPIGKIAADYASGRLDDDAAVALTFGPAELGFCPVSEPVVDIRDKLEQMTAAALISEQEATAITAATNRLHYAERTLTFLMQEAFPGSPDRADQIRRSYISIGPGAKQRDALALLTAIREEAPAKPLPSWRLAEPPFWKRAVRQVESEVGEGVTVESR